MVLILQLMLMLLRPSHAFVAAPTLRSCRGSIRRGVPRVSARAFSPPSTSTGPSVPKDDDDVTISAGRDGDAARRGRKTALLWLSPSRLRLRDNAALARAAELGPDGLAVCLVWPDGGASSSSRGLTPAEAFGYEAARALDGSLGKLGQRLWLIPSPNNGPEEGGHRDATSAMARAVRRLRPGRVVVDSCLLDRHRERGSRLREELRRADDGNATNDASTVVEEVMDDGLLIPFDLVPKALGRSRRGGRALRWSTFLGNAMAMMQNDDIAKPIWEISSLPPPLGDPEGVMPTMSMPVPATESFPSWARRLLSDWGEVSEDEAIRRADSSGSSRRRRAAESKDMFDDASSSSLTERGSRDSKLSPYLRWGVISPQRAARAGVRPRDLLWRDWSRVSYGLLGPLRRGDAVLEFMDGSCRGRPHFDDGGLNSTEEELFRLWCVGNVGSPLVDSGMRQLWREGWMPRRIRLLAAACLVEGLGIDWRRGRDWFEDTLVDHDPAINELMWQNAGLCGVDPFYSGIRWEAPPNTREEEDYVERWSGEEELTWPSSLGPSSTRAPPSQVADGAESRREVLRSEGVYKAARTVGNAGVRVAWKGLSNNLVDVLVKEGEVMGAGSVPVHELRIRPQ